MGVRFRLSNRMSVVRRVPRVLRKDYASMRWWKDQQPLETQDKSVATFRGGFWEAMIHPWFYPGSKTTRNSRQIGRYFPWWFLGSYDPPMVLHGTKTLDELPIRSTSRKTYGRTRLGRSPKIRKIQHFHLLRTFLRHCFIHYDCCHFGYSQQRLQESKGSCQRCPRFYCGPLRRCSFEKLIYSLILSAVPSISLSKIEFNC